MATSNTTTVQDSEETFDYVCASVCSKKNRVRESEKYCVQCGKHICSSCLEYHNDMQSGHTLVEPAKSSGYKPKSLLTEHCHRHPHMIIEHYCVNHDAIVCGTCAIIDHRLCSKVVHIPDKIQEIFKASDMQQSLTKLAETTSALTNHEKNADKAMAAIAVEKKKNIDRVQEHSKKLIAMVKALEKASIDNVKATCNSLEDLQKDNQQQCVSMKKDLQQIASKLSSKSNDDAQCFVFIKMAQAKLEQADKILKTSKQVAENKLTEFSIDQHIESTIAGFQSMGDFKTKSTVMPKSKGSWTAPPPPQPRAPMAPSLVRPKKITTVERYSVTSPRDINNCDISASCLLPNGYIMLADTGNKMLKCFSPFSKAIIGSCDMPEQLVGLCCVDNNTVAATMEDRSFCTVSTEHYTILRIAKPGHRCTGIAYCDGELFVTDGHQTIYVYTTMGLLRRKFQVSQLGKRFSDLGDLAISQAQLLYVTDFHYGVRCFDKTGKELGILKGGKLEGYRAVTADDKFGIVVLGCWSKNVAQFSNDGKDMGEFFTKDNGLENPRSISLDSEYNKLYVTELSNTIIMASFEV